MPTPLVFRRACIRALATVAATATASLAGCARDDTRSRAAVGDSAAAMQTASMPMGHMNMAAMMSDSGMAMLHGFCAAEPAAAPGAPEREQRVELIVGGDATQRATRISVIGVTARNAGLAAELTAGEDARAACAGAGRTILIGGTAMYLGTPVLRLTSGQPVTVLARTVHAQPLAGPVRVSPGQQGVVLEWGAAPR